MCAPHCNWFESLKYFRLFFYLGAKLKYSVNGINQEVAVKYGLKLPDTLLLNWARNIIGMPSAFVVVQDEKPYYWLKVDQVLSDYPILQIAKETLLKKFKKYADDGFFMKISKSTPSGTFGYYSPLPKFEELFQDSPVVHPQKNTGGNPSNSFLPSHPQKNAGGSELNAGGSELNTALPSFNTLSPNTPSSLNGSKTQAVIDSGVQLNEEEEGVFQTLQKELKLVTDLKRLRAVAKKHGEFSFDKIFHGLKHDMRLGRVNNIGALLSRLESRDRIEPQKKKPLQPKKDSETSPTVKKRILESVEISEYIVNLSDSEKLGLYKRVFDKAGYSDLHSESEIIELGVEVIKNQFKRGQAALELRAEITQLIMN